MIKVPNVKQDIMQNGPFQNNIYYIIDLELLMY